MQETILNNPLFKGLRTSEIDKLISHLPVKKYKPNELLIKQGDVATEMFILFEGKIETFYLSKDGTKTSIIFHDAPFITGEIELFDDYKYLANVAAIEPCKAIVLTKAEFLKLLHSNHQVSINLCRLLSYLLCETGEDRRVKFFGSVDNLLANLLCYHAKMFGKEEANGILITKEINKTELAESLSVARKTVIQSFKNLESEGLIQVQDKILLIPNYEKLIQKARSL